MSVKIGVVTCQSLGNYNNNAESEDAIVSELLAAEGFDFKFEVWSDPAVNWNQYTHLVVKSPWDYFDRYLEFKNWCENMIVSGIPVFNDLKTVLWNSDKKYLQEIQGKGHRIIPTRFLKQNQPVHIEPMFDEFATDNLIFKPSISGGAKNTLRLIKGSTHSLSDSLNELVKNEDFLLQPFIPEIIAEGEYSLIFFNGKFSHAVLKSPKEGDFRVQHFFGGKISSIQPSDSLMDSATKIVEDFAKDCLYARVDGVLIEGVFYLMELELIEPYLFLFTHPEAKKNYMAALKEKLAIGSI
ncbi:ATP-grasp domain-containing protein [Litoribacter ruber]|uniref:ATP-grasp domain-containing protein n=1 Tax=Litoribacter ruber TaxID=702568 RepID=UPI001FEC85DF|nr:glutathione synthetase [Litoribacter alkaliphilus]